MTMAGGVDLPGEVCGLVALDEVLLHGWDVSGGHRPAIPADRRRVRGRTAVRHTGRAGARRIRARRHLRDRRAQSPRMHRSSTECSASPVATRTGPRAEELNAHHRSDRRDELGVDCDLLPARQRARARASRWASLRTHPDVVGGLRRGRGVAGHRRVGPRPAVLLAIEATRLEAAGADLLVLCTNTMHKVADAIEGAVGIPLLHLGDVTAAAVRTAGLDTVGLLGTALHDVAGLLPRPARVARALRC